MGFDAGTVVAFLADGVAALALAAVLAAEDLAVAFGATWAGAVDSDLTGFADF